MREERRNHNQGMSLAETLAAILIMSLAGLMITSSVVAYIRSWNRLTNKANAEMLVSTLQIRMQDELQFATSVHVDSDGNVNWFAADSTGEAEAFVPGDKDSAFGIRRSKNPGALETADKEDFISDAMADNGMYGTYDSLTYDGTTHLFTITGLSARDASGDVLYQIDSIKIKNLNDAAVNE